ncbi:MAG: nucleotidyltransferase family protein [Succinivibrio sp.]|nr:nucleotidyltransferase family protein [Succinivibrio sp.]
MRAMLLAAGRGERLRPLTDVTPKPLIKVGGKPLLQWHLERLYAAGVREVVINSAHLGEQIVEFAGDGSRFGLKISHSQEPPGGLETLGGIVKALPFLGDEPFLVVNSDIYTDADYGDFVRAAAALSPQENGTAPLGVLFLTDNPPHHPQGDFALQNPALLPSAVIKGGAYTFSGIALYHPGAFAGFDAARRPLRPLFDRMIEQGTLAGDILKGRWFDVGTAERLAQTEAYVERMGLATY